jgi:transcriptional regulator with XRE-family HTH domain
MTAASLTAWRKRLGWSKAEAARRLGCSKNSILAWENGQAVPLYIALACQALANGLPPMN